MARLCWAQLLVAWVPFAHWRETLGSTVHHQPPSVERARQLAADVEWAATKLPFVTKCLPRAMALSWMLRRRSLCHTVVIAVRRGQLRHSTDALHAWVEIDGQIVLGELPGPWIETLRLGA